MIKIRGCSKQVLKLEHARISFIPAVLILLCFSSVVTWPEQKVIPPTLSACMQGRKAEVL